MEILFKPNKYYGIRDPIVLQDINGVPQKVDNKYIIIFNARTEKYESSNSETFPLISYSKDFKSWTEPKLLFKDGKYTAVGSIIKKNNIYYIFYSVNTKQGFKYAITKNLIDFEINNSFIFEQQNFKQINLMGLPFVTEVNNKYICLFEGFTKNGFRIFGAESNNLNTWTPINQGNPIYNGINYYEVLGQANPSLYKIENDYLIFYNGKDGSQKWHGSYLITTDFINYKSLKNPILDCGKIKNSNRIEGLRLIKINNDYEIIFFILPSFDSYKDGNIYIKFINITEK